MEVVRVGLPAQMMIVIFALACPRCRTYHPLCIRGLLN